MDFSKTVKARSKQLSLALLLSMPFLQPLQAAGWFDTPMKKVSWGLGIAALAAAVYLGYKAWATEPQAGVGVPEHTGAERPTIIDRYNIYKYADEQSAYSLSMIGQDTQDLQFEEGYIPQIISVQPDGGLADIGQFLSAARNNVPLAATLSSFQWSTPNGASVFAGHRTYIMRDAGNNFLGFYARAVRWTGGIENILYFVGQIDDFEGIMRQLTGVIGADDVSYIEFYVPQGNPSTVEKLLNLGFARRIPRGYLHEIQPADATTAQLLRLDL